MMCGTFHFGQIPPPFTAADLPSYYRHLTVAQTPICMLGCHGCTHCRRNTSHLSLRTLLKGKGIFGSISLVLLSRQMPSRLCFVYLCSYCSGLSLSHRWRESPLSCPIIRGYRTIYSQYNYLIDIPRSFWRKYFLWSQPVSMVSHAGQLRKKPL